MITQEQFDNLQVGDKIKTKNTIGEVQAIFNKVILMLWDDDEINLYCFNEIKSSYWELIKPIKYNQGFEVREYPERPVVLVGINEATQLRFLVEVKVDEIKCVQEGKPKNSSEIAGSWVKIKAID